MAAWSTGHPIATGMLKTFTAPYTYYSHYYTETTYYAIPLRHIFMISAGFLVVLRGIPFRSPPGVICVPAFLLSLRASLRSGRFASPRTRRVPQSTYPSRYITVMPLSCERITQIAYFFVRAQIVLGTARSGRSRRTGVLARTRALTTVPGKAPPVALCSQARFPLCNFRQHNRWR